MKKIPPWRYWLSHVWEQTLEVTGSEFNEYLQVSLVRGRLQLTAKEAIYSFGDYYLNFRKTFQRFRFDHLPPQAEVLILGLGLGSIPEVLTNHFGQSYHYAAVEIDPVIIELAAKYSLPNIPVNIEIVNSDAMTFLQLDARQYDLICMDVFQDAEVPVEFEDVAFLELLKHSLRPTGALIFNRLAANLQDRKKSRKFFEEVFMPVFPNGVLYNSGGNYMLVNHRKFLNSIDEANLS